MATDHGKSNEQRASWANHALSHYANTKGYVHEEDHDTLVRDLIADLLHSLEEDEPEDAMRTAMLNYREEKENEDD